MTVDTTLAGMTLADRLESAEGCAHTTFPEVFEQEWVRDLLASMYAQLAESVQDPAMTLDVLGNIAEHALIIAAAAGMAAGKAIASEELLDGFEAFSLDNVDWSDLPDVTEGD